MKYMGGLEYTTNECNNPHSTIGAHSEGALVRHLHCYIRGDYCQRAQATQNPSYIMAMRISTALSVYTVQDVNRGNAATVNRGGGTQRLIPSRYIFGITTNLQAPPLSLHPLSDPRQDDSCSGLDTPFTVQHQQIFWSRLVATISFGRCSVGY